uniref:Uncharacterized protein n=1 Tax=Cucumis melo TaxID=3656 RepID=A0A9I9E5Z3_CUCME
GIYQVFEVKGDDVGCVVKNSATLARQFLSKLGDLNQTQIFAKIESIETCLALRVQPVRSSKMRWAPSVSELAWGTLSFWPNQNQTYLALRVQLVRSSRVHLYIKEGIEDF